MWQRGEGNITATGGVLLAARAAMRPTVLRAGPDVHSTAGLAPFSCSAARRASYLIVSRSNIPWSPFVRSSEPNVNSRLQSRRDGPNLVRRVLAGEWCARHQVSAHREPANEHRLVTEITY